MLIVKKKKPHAMLYYYNVNVLLVARILQTNKEK